MIDPIRVSQRSPCDKRAWFIFLRARRWTVRTCVQWRSISATCVWSWVPTTPPRMILPWWTKRPSCVLSTSRRWPSRTSQIFGSLPPEGRWWPWLCWGIEVRLGDIYTVGSGGHVLESHQGWAIFHLAKFQSFLRVRGLEFRVLKLTKNIIYT